MKEWARWFYNSMAWRDTRDSVMRENNYTCAICNNKNGAAEIVHHKTWLNPNNINDINISLSKDNLIPVCRTCHANIHEGASTTENGLLFNEDGELIEVKNIHS